MKTSYLLTGNLIRLLLLIGGLWLTNSNIWGYSSYYATLEARVANASGAGKVYVNSDSPNDAVMSHAVTGSTTSSNGSVEMKAYAYPQAGYEFYKWEFVSAARNTKSKNSNHTAADITATTCSLTVTMCTPSGSKDNSEMASILVIRAIFWRPGGANVDKLTFRTTEHGKYSVKSIAKEGVEQMTYNFSNISTTAKEVSNVVAGMPIDCSATPDNGYIFYSYYTIDAYGNKAYIGDLFNPDQVLLLDDDVVELGTEFTDNSYCVGKTLLPTLSDALQFVKTSEVKTIQVVKDNMVEAGYYTIPAGVTLLVPYKANQTPTTMVERTMNVAYVKPSLYRKLSLANGVHLDVFGSVEAGCKQSAQGQSDAANGSPTGPYGQIEMMTGSDMTIESGGSLRAWGFVTGEGSIDVRRGGEVHEQFQLLDFKGGTNTQSMCGSLSKIMDGTASNEGDVFPLNQYFIQNVECRATYHPGAKLYASTAFYMSMDIIADDIQLIGTRNKKDGTEDDVALFLLDDGNDGDDTWVCKYYDNATDRQTYEINNSATIGSFVITTVDGYKFPTKNFTLPITNNMLIHLLTGKMDMNQNTVLLAGSEIILDKQSTFIVPEGVKLYLYDQAEWDKFVFSGFYAQKVKYVPLKDGAPTARPEGGSKSVKPASASIKVGGAMQIDGAIYTTKGGANITSTNEDAGTIMFNKNGAPLDSSKVYQWMNSEYVYAKTPSAILQNEDSNHPTTTTAGTPAGQSYCYMNGKWTMMTVDEDNSCFVYDNYGNYYAKPGEYVMINATKTEGTFSGNTDHTYSDAAGTGRLFILMDDCQWWEVENVDNLYHCIHPQNDTYYSWNDTNKKWEEKKFAISWKDYDGSPIVDSEDTPIIYYLPYGATPKFLSTNPTRSADADYTYNFKGWSPTIGTVSGDQTYTAVYEKTEVKYEIVFKYEEGIKSGAIIKRQFLVRDAVPEPPTLYPIDGYESYEWTPAIGAVTGNQVYEAKWLVSAPTTYAITFKNYDGSILKKSDGETDAVYDVTIKERPEYDGTTPAKASTSEYTYEFAGWKALNGTVYANNALPVATEKTTYVAQFTPIEKKFNIRFFQEDGTTQIDTTQSLVLGADPVVPNYSKSNTAQYTFRLQWKNMDTDVIVGVSVPSVSDSANYQAVIDTTINRYTITAVSEDENGVAIAGCTFTGAGTYDYGTNITLTAIPNEGYEFVEWQDKDGNRLATTDTMWVDVTANRTYTAVVRSAAMEVLVDESKTFSRPTTITDLVINASEDGSSNLNGLENLTVTRDAYFIYSFKATRFNRQTQNWYAFGVPFKVDALTGISANGRQLVLGRDIDIVYYDGQKRADNGADNSAWTYVEDQSSKVLQPGVLYLAAFAADYDKVQFLKQSEATLNNDTAAVVKTYTSTSNNNDGDANWNGIANPALYHAYLNAGTLDGQTYRSIDGSWQVADLSKDTFTIGRPVFVQVQKPQSVVVSRPAASSAPLRRQASMVQSDRFDLQLLTPQDKTADRLFVIANEDAADTYTIGEDIAKAGVSTRVAQMWIDRYGARLCKNTIAATDNAALYPLTLTAPAAGSYTLQATAQSGDARLYLTYLGEVIADLSANNYTIDLVKGTNSGYGLRLVTTRRDVVTDLDEVLGPNSTSDNEAGTEQTQKCLYRNQLYLIRGGQVYDAQGQRVQ